MILEKKPGAKVIGLSLDGRCQIHLRVSIFPNSPINPFRRGGAAIAQPKGACGQRLFRA